MIDSLGLWTAHEANLRLRGLSACTVDQRRRVIGNLTATIDAADITGADVNAFLASKPNQKTRSVYRTHIVTFYRWCYAEGLLPADPTGRVPKILTRRGVPRPIADDGFLVALEAASDANLHLWLLLGYDAGLRCMEIAGLRRENIYRDHLIVLGKGDKERTVPFTPRLAAVLAEWDTGGVGWVFRGRKGGHVAASSVSTLLARHLHACGVAATGHRLRHSFASRVYRESQDIRLTQELLGHASLASTQVYAAADMTKAAAVMAAI